MGIMLVYSLWSRLLQKRRRGSAVLSSPYVVRPVLVRFHVTMGRLETTGRHNPRNWNILGFQDLENP